MPGKPGTKMTPEEAYCYGLARETFCAVENDKKEAWCRATRKHFSQHNKSTVFESAYLPEDTPLNLNVEKLKERRHYDSQCKCEKLGRYCRKTWELFA